ncbi:DedA family protein [Tundrisphaera sp. TA3]|uniref:DedA family protein n=1 Tax=Tundrisphaera sp. TA3 TaxID=3435775 RepID=UPI003EBDC8D0
MAFLQQLFETLLHLSPESINTLAQSVGPWLYVILFAIVFAETGLVVVPFLPGDSLLFAVGAVAASPGSPINLGLTMILLLVAAVVGDAVNYAIGKRIGPRVFSRDDSWLLNKKHLTEAQAFYDRYGGKTIILARFVPIIRTFAPFVAGIGRMNYARFAAFNVIGAVAWVAGFLGAGWWFGGREVVKKNFHLVIVAIILISVIPALFEFAKGWLAARRGRSAIVEATSLEPTLVPDEPEVV